MSKQKQLSTHISELRKKKSLKISSLDAEEGFQINNNTKSPRYGCGLSAYLFEFAAAVCLWVLGAYMHVSM